jgi:hypothetical protein
MSVVKGKGLKAVGELFPRNKIATPAVGSKDSEFAKIEGSILTYKDKCYEISAVSPLGVLVLETDELTQFSKMGDEFPLVMVR